MRVLAALALLVAGAATGVATVAVHDRWWGLALAVTATAATLVALPAGWWSRLPFALGWVGFIGWIVNPRPEGDYVIAQDAQGYLLLAVAFVALVFGVATLPRPRRG